MRGGVNRAASMPGEAVICGEAGRAGIGAALKGGVGKD
jgi:hypothetical protein